MLILKRIGLWVAKNPIVIGLALLVWVMLATYQCNRNGQKLTAQQDRSDSLARSVVSLAKDTLVKGRTISLAKADYARTDSAWKAEKRNIKIKVAWLPGPARVDTVWKILRDTGLDSSASPIYPTEPALATAIARLTGSGYSVYDSARQAGLTRMALEYRFLRDTRDANERGVSIYRGQVAALLEAQQSLKDCHHWLFCSCDRKARRVERKLARPD
ncbi:hypothetical protein [Spirosoma sordidisoli]|uniref:Uncharacterized protein n=1 Tax=Spirosoma sordidisoli TaxID=2502893 RepID=A0A4Q2UPB0_9BACT|nr:hypothetical protein [Spirosoma sordidisoli]RYC69631.1 hypothetical protein EQG79_13605 [Spirosoma sordidisoli]